MTLINPLFGHYIFLLGFCKRFLLHTIYIGFLYIYLSEKETKPSHFDHISANQSDKKKFVSLCFLSNVKIIFIRESQLPWFRVQLTWK